MINAGPTPQSNFKAKVAEQIAQDKKTLEALSDNARRASFLLTALNNQKIAFPSNVVPLISATLRENGLTDHTQPLIDIIEKNKDYLSTCQTNSGRAAFLTARLVTTSNASFTQAQIQGVLHNEGFTDKAPNTQIPYLLYATILLSFYSILCSLQKNPGHYARNLSVELTTRTIGSSIRQENKLLLIGFYIMLFSIQLSVMFGFMPSLGSLFNYFPEELDPKTYGDKLVPHLAETYGSGAYYALVPLIMLMQRYGSKAVIAGLNKMFDNPLVTAAHEFATLMRNDEDAEALLQQHPELNDSVAVRGITWGYNARQLHETKEASSKPTATSDAILRIAP